MARYLCRDLSVDEEKVLMEWVEASPGNKDLFHKIVDNSNWKRYVEQASCFDLDKAKREMKARIVHERRKMIWRKIYQSAAILFIPALIASLVVYYVSDREVLAPAITPVAVMPKIQPVLPGDQKARLQLSTGAVVDLGQENNSELEEDGTDILIADNRVKYQESIHKENNTLLYNTLVVPQGGEYSLELSDGTVVYLNAMSSLKFPVQFPEDKRIVELEGEAFFDVQKNGTPFIVKTPRTQIEVLGTTFNICAYNGESTYATLVKGTIRISTKNESMLLKPSQQAVIQQNSEKIAIHQVDVDFYSSWHKGKIYFRDTRLEDIMNALSRWYNIQVSYGDEEVANLRFGCYVNRRKEIAPFLNHLKSTGKVRVVQRGNKIYFYSIN
jgi:ferric-dicitrate binding protein FerR (iron transport regulator)